MGARLLSHASMIAAAIALLFAFASTSHASGQMYAYLDIEACVAEQSVNYGVPPAMIWKLIRVESNGVTTALHVNNPNKSFSNLSLEDAEKKLRWYIEEDKSVDVGLMQINTYHLRRSIKVSKQEMLMLLDPCYNIAMGAYILAHRFHHVGYNWGAIASYNVGINGMKGGRGPNLQKIGAKYVKRVQKAKGKAFSVRTPVTGLIQTRNSENNKKGEKENANRS